MKLDKNNLPDKNGFFGEYGGKFVPETLMYALEELETTYEKLKNNNEFNYHGRRFWSAIGWLFWIMIAPTWIAGLVGMTIYEAKTRDMEQKVEDIMTTTFAPPIREIMR